MQFDAYRVLSLRLLTIYSREIGVVTIKRYRTDNWEDVSQHFLPYEKINALNRPEYPIR